MSRYSDEYEARLFPTVRHAWQVAGSFAFLILLLALTCAGCVRRGQVCLTAEHGQVDPNWSRSNNVGASVCAEVAPPGE